MVWPSIWKIETSSIGRSDNAQKNNNKNKEDKENLVRGDQHDLKMM